MSLSLLLGGSGGNGTLGGPPGGIPGGPGGSSPLSSSSLSFPGPLSPLVKEAGAALAGTLASLGLEAGLGPGVAAAVGAAVCTIGATASAGAAIADMPAGSTAAGIPGPIVATASGRLTDVAVVLALGAIPIGGVTGCSEPATSFGGSAAEPPAPLGGVSG